MDDIDVGSQGAAVEDVQRRLDKLGYDLGPTGIDGVFADGTAAAVRRFRSDKGLPDGDSIDTMTWAALVDASYSLGDRTLYLRMPYFHGNDVGELQNILNILGFSCGPDDSIFGAYTERAVRDFQTNMGIEPDGIVGLATTNALFRLHRSWTGKDPVPSDAVVGFSRAADVLESTPICVYGTDESARKIASAVSNLALATTSLSLLRSADTLSTAPGPETLMVEITTGEAIPRDGIPTVVFETPRELAARFANAVKSLGKGQNRVVVSFSIPDASTQTGESDISENYGRGIVQHSAIILLDAICYAFVS